MFRARLSLFALEGRDNPSGPSPIDPIGGEVPAPVPPPADSTPVVIGNIGGSIAGGAADAGSPPVPTAPTSSLGHTDPLFTIPTE